MRDHEYAATPWEVEAERRREVIAGDARTDGGASRRDPSHEIPAVGRGRGLLANLRGSIDEPPAHAGKLNQKRV